jgi:type II secretory pathway component GspD/PulD (secretin)
VRPPSTSRYSRLFALLATLAFAASALPTQAQSHPPRSAGIPTVLPVTVIGTARAAAVLRTLYPRAHISIDAPAHALIVVAPVDDVAGMRAILLGIDVRDPTRPVTEAVQLRSADPAAVASQLRRLFPALRVTTTANKTLIVAATPADLAQVKALLATIDAPLVTPVPSAAPVDAVRVTRAAPRDVARAIAHQFRGVRASVAGSSVVLSGPPDEVAKAKALVALIDQPQAGVRYTQIYRLRYVDARSVGELITRSFREAQVSPEPQLNALSVLAAAPQQQRIADALAQLDTTLVASGGPPVLQPGSIESATGSTVEVVALKAATPGLNGAPSSSASDIATVLTQALQAQAPDLHVTVPPNGTQLVLTGSPFSIRAAKNLIDQLDVEQKLVILDTQILEVDESAAKNLGLSFSAPVVSTTLSETTPSSPDGGTPPPFLRLQPLTRTPLSFGLSLNLLVQSGKGRVLADPRITTISGRTATIRAGDNIAILTTTGGGTGTVATTQLQTFQTGVTLDITPVVNAGNFITVALHPTVNSLAGIANGIPQIATRDTQTTVAMREDETLVIGGLIQDTTTRNQTKIPLLGDLPLLGRVFRNEELTHQRNELIIAVTPHIVSPGAASLVPGSAPPTLPAAAALPTLPPGTALPPARPRAAPTPPPTLAPATGAAAPRLPPSPPPPASTTFTYGDAAGASAAGPADPVRILYLSFAPTVVRNGTPVRVTALTTTNVARLTIAHAGFQTQLAQTAPGRWEAAYNFTTTGLPAATGSLQLSVTAARLDGASATLAVPLVVAP